MKIKHKKIAYKVLNIFVTFLFAFQIFYPFFYTIPVFAQTTESTKAVTDFVEETQTPATTTPPEVILTPTIEPIITPEITPTPAIEFTSIPENVLTPTINPTSTPVEILTPTPELTSIPSTAPPPAITTTPLVTLKVLDTASAPSGDIKSLSQENPTREKMNPSKKLKKQKPSYVEGEVIVKYKQDKINLKTPSGLAEAYIFEKKYSLEKTDELKDSNIQVFKSKVSTEEMIEKLKSDPNIEYVEPNYIRYPSTISTNDTYKNLLWGLDNTGQIVSGTAGSSDADIDAPEAWALSEGSTSVIVAVIDSGVAYSHPDLLANMWDGSSCKDENGDVLGSCNHGYDFENSDKTPLPDSSSHGTHIAGTIAAVKNNSKGIIGVAPQVKIMALKVSFTVVQIVEAIDYAIQNEAKVINASYGAEDYSLTEYDAINRFRAADGIFVAAAGNESVNNDGGVHTYPSDYDLDNIISVTATDQSDNLASFSNYGLTSVDLGAPGVNIYSTIPTETTVLNETFNSLVAPNIPSGWVKGGTSNNWGTYYFGGDIGNVLYGDLAYPYYNSRDTYVNSPTYNLVGGGASISFWAICDTEYTTSYWSDYMQLEYSSDGTNFSPATDPYFGGDFRWDEAYLDFLNDDSSPTGNANYYFEDVLIESEYLTSNFRLGFRWVSNSSDNDYDGCFLDDIEITKFSDGSDEKYEYEEGTSMATPHVAGGAALLLSINPDLTTAQVKTLLINYGDTKAPLIGKTVSGKRLNIFNSLSNAETPTEPTFDPSATTQFGPIHVLLDSTYESSIKYTTNGSTPACDLGTTYSSSFLVTPPVTVKAIGCSDLFSSPVASISYTSNVAASTWYLAEGSTGGFSVYVLVQNPTSSPANITATFMLTGGENISKSYTVPANSRYTIIPANEIGTGKAFSTKVESDQDIIVERAMYWDAGGVHWAGGHNTMGTTTTH